MELELQREEERRYVCLAAGEVCGEETLELIVPDASPDIQKLLCTEGTVLLRQREATAERVVFSGVVRTTAFYVPEGGGLERLEAELPFRAVWEQGGIQPEDAVQAFPRLTGAQTRVLNPRKVLLRVNFAIGAEVWRPDTLRLCTGIPEGGRWGVETAEEERELTLVTAAVEKDFVMEDEVALPGNRGAAAAILRQHQTAYTNEVKRVGGKLVVKGGVLLELLCREEGGGIYAASLDVPFGQILDAQGAGEDCVPQLSLVVNDCLARLKDDGGRTVSVYAALTVQALLRERKTVRTVTDAYSIPCPSQPEFALCPAERLVESGVRRQNLRETVETGAQTAEVLACLFQVEHTGVEKENGTLTLCCEGTAAVLYREDGGAFGAVQRRFSVRSQTNWEETCEVKTLCNIEDAGASPLSNGVELHCTAAFAVVCQKKAQFPVLDGLSLEEAAGDRGARPSVILAQPGPGESLWDLAKRYRTGRAAILQANELEKEPLPQGRLLLIPVSRG